MKTCKLNIMQQDMLFGPDSIQKLYAITPDEPDTDILLAKVSAALKGGASVIQYRNKLANDALQYEQAIALLKLTQQFDVPLIINDNAQLAFDIGAAGTHIGKSDGALATLRQQFPKPFMLGASCYNSLETARQAIYEGADYIAFGRFFPSTTKPGSIFAETALISAIQSEHHIPIVGIGGITVDNASSLIDAKIDAIAVVADLFCRQDIEARARQLTQLFDVAKS